MAKHTIKILCFEHRKIFKVHVAIFQREWKSSAYFYSYIIGLLQHLHLQHSHFHTSLLAQ